VYGVGGDASYVDVRLTGVPSDQTTYYTVVCEVRTSASLANGRLVGVAHYPTSTAGDANEAAEAAQALAEAAAAAAEASAADAAASAASSAAIIDEMFPLDEHDISAALGFEPTPRIRTRRVITTAGTHVVSAEDDIFETCVRTTADVRLDVASIQEYRPYRIANDYNTGVVLVDGAPHSYFRNVHRAPGLTDTRNNSFKLGRGASCTLWRITTGEIWVLDAYAPPHYRFFGSPEGVDGFISRGVGDRYYGQRRLTISPGDNIIILGNYFVGVTLAGTSTVVTGVMPVAATGLAPKISHVSSGVNGSGQATITLNSAEASAVTCIVSFTNLTAA
jgi:hypothetical protein